MKRKAIILLSCVFIMLSVFIYTINWLFFDLDRIPKGTLLTEQISPNKTYTIKVYNSDAGATTSFSILAELHFNKEKKKPKIIYFQYKESTAFIKWKDDNTVIINNVELNLPNEKYDYRRN